MDLLKAPVANLLWWTGPAQGCEDPKFRPLLRRRRCGKSGNHDMHASVVRPATKAV